MSIMSRDELNWTLLKVLNKNYVFTIDKHKHKHKASWIKDIADSEFIPD